MNIIIGFNFKNYIRVRGDNLDLKKDRRYAMNILAKIKKRVG